MGDFRHSNITLVTISGTGRPSFNWNLELPVEENYPSLRDDSWSVNFGILQAQLETEKKEVLVTVCFSEIGWIDPLPLLGLATTLRAFIENSNSTFTIDLGQDSPDNQRRGAFLRFIAEHKFLRAFWSVEISGRITYVFGNNRFNSDAQLSVLERKLESSGHSLTYDNSLCLRAKLFRASGGKENESFEKEKHDLVSDCLEEIREYVLKPFFTSRPEMIDILIYKLRVVLFEVIENAYEHAFSNNDQSSVAFGGIYARMRKKTSGLENEKRWIQAQSYENKHCPTLKYFKVTPQSDWIEIFYYDPGVGLLNDLHFWAEHAASVGNNQLVEIISTLKPTSNRLDKISKFMFTNPFSRFGRDGRTAITGLQHIGLVLANENDFARACVDREWVGGVHPWKEHIKPTPDNYAKRNTSRGLPNTLGTAWHFCVQVRTEEVKLPDYWVSLSTTTRQLLVDNPGLSPLGHEELAKRQIYDERELSSTVSEINLSDLELESDMFFWLPGDARKQRVHQWISALKEKPNVTNWIIADIPAYQAGPVAEILLKERFGYNFVIYMVTDDWRCACLCVEEGGQTGSSVQKADEYLRENIELLFCLLRAHDSKRFWEGIPSDPALDNSGNPPFVYEPVNWEGSNGINATLQGYLELTQALIEPIRVSVCRRSLLRTWHLFCSGTCCEPSDSLLAGLLPERSIKSNITTAEKDSIGKTNVNSVLVTGSTAERNKMRGYRATIHLLRHGHVKFIGGAPSLLEPVALDWMTETPKLSELPENKLPFQRIPGTPFIGRGGPKAVPIRRFGKFTKDSNGTYQVFQESFYGEAPAEMYEHFTRLGILKLGHWCYEGHHDLFTINLAKAYSLEKIDNGPLVKWLTETFQQLHQENVQILIYPSHLVTDYIIRDLRATIPDSLPKHVIPVHFLGQHSQSSIRIPSLTYDRIKQILAMNNEAKSVVLFDDGTITGKVARELEHLIKNAGAKTVYTVTLVTRTGLPLYRKLIKQTSKHRRHYWRWDVPALGSRRTCPLCRAVEQAELIKASMPTGTIKDRVNQWSEYWKHQDVVQQWEEHGLSPMALPNPRTMTFGKEWLPNNEVMHYEIKHTTTTSIATMVAELIRTTTYKGVGLKIADEPGGLQYKGKDGVYLEPDNERTIWDRTKLEILIGQVFLFFDDLDRYELIERLNRIFRILMNRTEQGEIEALAGLTFLLVDSESAENIINSQIDELCHSRISSPDGKLALGYILVKSKIDWILKTENSTNLTIAQSAMLRENLMYAWHLYAERKRDTISINRTSFLSMVLLLGDTEDTMHCGFLRRRTVKFDWSNIGRVIDDLKILESALRQVNSLLHENITKPQFSPADEEKILDELLIKLVDSHENNDQPKTENFIKKLHEYLFGEDGLADKFQKDSLMSVKNFKGFLQLEGRYDEAHPEWVKEIENKVKTKKDNTIKTRWQVKEEYQLPNIDVRIPDGTDSLMLLVPPLVRQVIWENMKNVVHSPHRLKDDTGEETIDLRIDILEEDSALILSLKMCAKKGITVPQGKTNEAMLSSLLDCTVRYELIENPGDAPILQTKIPIITVSSLGKVTL